MQNNVTMKNNRFECPVEGCKASPRNWKSICGHLKRNHSTTYSAVTGTKRCTECKEVKAIYVFYKNIRMADGYGHYCKPCANTKTKEYNKSPKGREIKNKLKSDHYKTPGGRFKLASNRAKYKGAKWTLLKEEYIQLISKPCEYCTYELNPTGIGLDQVNPSLGYTIENVVPCCGACNQAKNDEFTYEEMKIIGEAIRQVKEKRIELKVKDLCSNK